MNDINIVIVNYKMKDDIDKCLDSLFSDVADCGLKIVIHVMDNSDNVDGVKELLHGKYPLVEYVDSGGNIGFGKAQNIGFRLSKAKYYLSLNPDIQFNQTNKVIKKFYDYMEVNQNVGIAAPKLLNSDGSVQLSSMRFFGFFDQIARRLSLGKYSNCLQKRIDQYLMKDFDHESTVKVDWIMGSFMFVSGKLTEKIGFFDDRYFMYFEDCDWCRRSWEEGREVHYVHDYVLMHGHRRDSADSSPLFSIFTNKIVRIHLKSWMQYFLKWGLAKKHYGV